MSFGLGSSSETGPGAMSQTIMPSLTPKVLTKSLIPLLTHGLDASDVLECYSLIRNTPLHGPIANSTLTIHKTSIGFRYRPPGAMKEFKKPLEMTLEYGPQRFGQDLTHDALPVVQTPDEDDQTSAVAWDNSGKVYYTTKIVNDHYHASYYMASMTGAVLKKILEQAVDYAEQRKLYQPFTVYSAETNKKELRSSSSADFSHFLWQSLADLGVEIEPILPPPRYETRVWVDSWSKVPSEPTVVTAASLFYQKLYDCLDAVATNDYTAFTPTVSPTVSPSPTPASERRRRRLEATVVPSMEKTTDEELTDDFVVGSDTDDKFFTNEGEEDPDSVEGGEEEVDGESDESNKGKQNDDDDETRDESLPGESSTENLDSSVDSSLNDDHTSSPSPTETPTETPLDAQSQADEEIEKAQQAADEAQKAVDVAMDAAQTDGDTRAADAAQNAADLAKIAVDATSNAAAQAAMEGLLSGDGDTITSIVTTCLTNPKYGISQVDENGTVTSDAYLYRDGSVYYKMSLAPPYLEIEKVRFTIHKPVMPFDVAAGGDALDWSLAIMVLIAILLMVIVIMQQMGINLISPLYHCQRWFFNPRKYDYEGRAGYESVGNVSTFGEEAIPLSMGGRLTHESPIRRKDTLQNEQRRHRANSADQLGLPTLQVDTFTPRKSPAHSCPDNVGLGDVELSIFPDRSFRQRVDSCASFSDDSVELDEVPERLYRDPDLVDLPYLKSTSKVAVPVGTPSNASLNASLNGSNSSRAVIRTNSSHSDGSFLSIGSKHD